MPVSLDDKYTLTQGRAYLNGIEALVRLLLVQHMRDAAAGIDTASVAGRLARIRSVCDLSQWPVSTTTSAP